ncbi:hypothetical protein KOI35_03125 [Actinoplanes bogorensis]|uniref:Uncharacterized protein n=1 Tax=Paractinoplanes bogorensis TaxID=1610840 RepID=A0ABS5YIC2_9ACTN|nr:hypothetical protein [Actinoplanes bogorensis]MBU2662493.1 hypothetical protein [Actinoplanes bogorensis]
MTPPQTPAAETIAAMTEGLPARAIGELTEHDTTVARRAFWLTTTPNGRVQHEFYGYAAAPGTLLAVTCMYDDPADLEWAQHVWRSIRHTGGTREW